MRYERKFPFWIRLFLLPWSLLCIPFILFYLGLVQSTDWANTPILGAIFATFGFMILPLGFSAMILWYALFGDAVDLKLNAQSGEITLQRKSPFRNRLTRYPLASLQIYKVELESDYPVYDAAIVTLRMPDGIKVRIGANILGSGSPLTCRWRVVGRVINKMGFFGRPQLFCRNINESSLHKLIYKGLSTHIFSNE
jgi:hypothetical protein